MKTNNKMIEQRIEQGNNTRKEILQAIIRYIEEHGYAPSYEEIGELTGKARVTIHRHIHIMLEEGVIETDSDFSPRAIRVPGYKFTKVEPSECQDTSLRKWSQQKPKTNGERIRSMNDEELAEFLLKVNCAYGEPCMTGETDCKWEDYPNHQMGCKDCFIEWVKKEAKEE